MKLGIILLTASLLTGCASSGWQDYKEVHSCVGTSELMRKTEVLQQQSTGVGVMSTSVTPSVRMKTYRRYDCSNGSTWGPA